jgi:hypothetical protein
LVVACGRANENDVDVVFSHATVALVPVDACMATSKSPTRDDTISEQSLTYPAK